ncbi:hypothetical protein T484DRAFT_1931687 [Baffinella frigidus]|nr:hypothetical protein T484DRAFT_1931687 [Cryptophyta sp. CCMP2293]
MGLAAEMTSRRRALVVGGVACLAALSAITLLAATRVQARTELLGSRRGVILSGAALPPLSLSAPMPPGNAGPPYDTSDAVADMDAALAVAEKRIKSMYAGIAAQRKQFQEEERMFAAEKEAFEEEVAATGRRNEAEAERLIVAAKELSDFWAGIEREWVELDQAWDELEAKQASFRAEQEEAGMNHETDDDAPVDEAVAAAGAAADRQPSSAVSSSVMTRGERVLEHLRATGAWPAAPSGGGVAYRNAPHLARALNAPHVARGRAATVKAAVAGGKHGAAAAGASVVATREAVVKPTVVAKPAKVAVHPRRPARKGVSALAGAGKEKGATKGATKAKPWFNWSGFGVKLQASWQPGHQAWYANLDEDQSSASRGSPSVLAAFVVAVVVALVVGV